MPQNSLHVFLIGFQTPGYLSNCPSPSKLDSHFCATLEYFVIIKWYNTLSVQFVKVMANSYIMILNSCLTDTNCKKFLLDFCKCNFRCFVSFVKDCVDSWLILCLLSFSAEIFQYVDDIARPFIQNLCYHLCKMIVPVQEMKQKRLKYCYGPYVNSCLMSYFFNFQKNKFIMKRSVCSAS